MTQMQVDNRRAHRRIVMGSDTRIVHDGDPHRARILNISVGGAGLLMEMRLPDATEITIEIEDIGIFPARVVRQMKNVVGVKFEFSEEKEQILIQKIANLLARKRREQFRIVS